MNSIPFILGEIYKRTQLHDKHGGNRQSGISVSAKQPYILIFSGKSGIQHGYEDRWENENVFSYTGEGQIGDMKFLKGNLALRAYLSKGRRVFLFTEVVKSYVRFEDELEFIDVDFFPGLDKNKNERVAIRFFFKRAGKDLDYAIGDLMMPNVGVHNQPLLNLPTVTERKGLITSRVGQGAYRKSILHRWQFRCAVTNFSKNEILIASHIVPWKDSSHQERLDVNNGILLSPTYDALFDRHLISFENNGKILISEGLKNLKYNQIGVTGKERIANLSSENIPYLQKHRENLAV